MKRFYEVIVGSDLETATILYRVLRSNVVDAGKAALLAYRSNNDKLYGHVRVMQIKEVGKLDG